MSWTKYLLLLAMVIGAAGLSVWVVGAALAADQLSGQVFYAVLPLVMIASLAWRALGRGKGE